MRKLVLVLLLLSATTASAQQMRRPQRPKPKPCHSSNVKFLGFMADPCVRPTASPGLVSVPSPASSATGVAINATLAWVAASNAASYRVGFDTQSPPRSLLNADSTTFDPGPLINGQTYYWQVTAVNDLGSRQGPIWNFTTIAGPPGTPVLIAPGNASAGVSLTPTLQWTALGATSYDVAFGDTNPPPNVVMGQAGDTYAVGTLSNSTTYYWQIVAINGGGSTTGAVFSFTTVEPDPPEPPPPPSTQWTWDSRATLSGSFKLPACTVAACGALVGGNFIGSGKGLGFNPATNSLFVSGAYGTVRSNVPMLTAEVAIPSTLGTGTTGTAYTSWPFATVLQPFKDATEGAFEGIATECGAGSLSIIGGYLVYGGNLWFSEYCYYDSASLQVRSHFKRPLNLSTTGSVIGPGGFTFPLSATGPAGGALSDYDRWLNGYLAAIPTDWQGPLRGKILSGPVADTNTGSTSQGPAFLAWNPDTFAAGAGANVAQALAYYTFTHPIAGGGVKSCSTTRLNCPPPVAGMTNYVFPSGEPSTVWNTSTTHVGTVFVSGTNTVLMFEYVGTGSECYGIGVSATGASSSPFPADYATKDYCYDPSSSSRGTHAYPYRFQVKAYDATDFLATVAGAFPWLPVPYATTAISLPFSTSSAIATGVGYDPATQRVFILQPQSAAVNGSRPFIHVYQLTVP